MTPDDDLVWIGHPGLFRPDVEGVHVSVIFEWDIRESREIAAAWSDLGYQVHIGGPALDDSGGDFMPGMYVRHGIVVTSRGCPRRCWFCKAWLREGTIRELPIHDGYNVIDNNLLACSQKHIEAVFEMLAQQPQRAVFSGGLDPGLVDEDIATMLWNLRPERFYVAYDTPDDLALVKRAGVILQAVGFTRAHHMMCYVLIGYPRDTITAATARLLKVWRAGFTPMAMLYRRDDRPPDPRWRSFQRSWARPASVRAQCKATT